MWSRDSNSKIRLPSTQKCMILMLKIYDELLPKWRWRWGGGVMQTPIYQEAY